YKIKEIAQPNTLYTFEFPPYNVTIFVFNASNNMPIENAQVEILAFEDNATLFSKTTSSEGIVQFDLDPGAYYINLSYKSYNFIQYKEILADPQISYHLPPYKLSVQIIDYWDNPIENANVSANDGNILKTNASGYVEFYLDPDIYNISASWGELSNFQIIDMSSYQESFSIVIKLIDKVLLDINVVNAISGRDLLNACVSISEFAGEFVATKFTNLNGSCQFTLSIGVYNLTVLYENSIEYQLINLTSDSSVIFSIIPYYTLTVITFDDSATSYTPNVLVQIYEIGGQLISQDFTDLFGMSSFNLEYGTYNVSIQKGSEHKWEIIDISQPEMLYFHVAPYKITVQVINSTTLKPISNALLTIYTYEGELITSNTTDDLGVQEFLLDSGQYFVFLNISENCWVKELDIRSVNSSQHLIFSVSISVSSKIDVGDPTEYSASLLQQTVGLTESIVYILAIILTILVSFSIMNVVSSCISESRKYIGVLRSIGASIRQIYYIFNFRIILISLLAGFLGGLLGIMIGTFISIQALEISLLQILTPQLFSTLLGLSVGMAVIIGLVSANLTLYRILKMPIAVSVKEILPESI
ncbi:MAG: FtsX-like permease family protein, partial [Candidatus Helarchaeota archaeon]